MASAGKEEFIRIRFSKPYFSTNPKKLSKLRGFDTEAYTDGRPFMFCTSSGDVFVPGDIPDVLFSRKHRDTNFLTYNLKYDSGAILRHLPLPVLDRLRTDGDVIHDGIRYEYILHKMLRISRGKAHVRFWDVVQFYNMSLDRAARKYLGEGKLDPGTKAFTKEYVMKHWDDIAEYCVKDAQLTLKLGLYLIRKLEEYGVTVSNLYSQASVSFAWFSSNGKIVTSWPQ